MTVSPSRRASLLTKAEYAYEQMRAQILSGELAAGSLLVSESIAVDLGLSTTPVREAMRRLAGDDLITLTAHRDARVKPLSRSEIEGLYDVRRVLDSRAVNLACERASEEQLLVPTQLLQAQRDLDSESELVHNRQFHRSIYGCCGNDVLITLLETLWDRSDRYRRTLPQTARVAALLDQDHVALAEAFARRDAAAMQVVVQRHLEGSLNAMLSKLDR